MTPLYDEANRIATGTTRMLPTLEHVRCFWRVLHGLACYGCGSDLGSTRDTMLPRLCSPCYAAADEARSMEVER